MSLHQQLTDQVKIVIDMRGHGRRPGGRRPTVSTPVCVLATNIVDGVYLYKTYVYTHEINKYRQGALTGIDSPNLCG